MADQVARNPEVETTVDLEERHIRRPGLATVSFSLDARLRNKLLLGLRDLDEILRYRGEADVFLEGDQVRRPWVYNWH